MSTQNSKPENDQRDCVVYCDDVLIFTNTNDPADHLLKLNAVLETQRAHEPLIKGSKPELFRSKVEFLGFQLSQDSWAPTESKVTAMMMIVFIITLGESIMYNCVWNSLVFSYIALMSGVVCVVCPFADDEKLKNIHVDLASLV